MVEDLAALEEIRKFSDRAKKNYDDLLYEIDELKGEREGLKKNISELGVKRGKIVQNILVKQRELSRKALVIRKEKENLLIPIEKKEKEIVEREKDLDKKEKSLKQREKGVIDSQNSNKIIVGELDKRQDELEYLKNYLSSLQEELEGKVDEEGLIFKKNKEITERKSQELEKIILLKEEQNRLLKKVQLKVEEQNRREETLKRIDKQLTDQAKRLSSERLALKVAWEELNTK